MFFLCSVSKFPRPPFPRAQYQRSRMYRNKDVHTTAKKDRAEWGCVNIKSNIAPPRDNKRISKTITMAMILLLLYLTISLHFYSVVYQ